MNGVGGGYGGGGLVGGSFGGAQPISPTSFGFGHSAGPKQMAFGPQWTGRGLGYNGAFPFMNPYDGQFGQPTGAPMGYPYSGLGMMNPYMQGFGDEPPKNAPEIGGAAR